MALLIDSGQIGGVNKNNYDALLKNNTMDAHKIPIAGQALNEKTNTNDNLTFWDFLDIINPLQHIPGISSIYRAITGDEIGSVAKIAGSTLYGGPLGAVSSIIDVAVDISTGKDIGEHAFNALNLSSNENIKKITTEPPLVLSHFNTVDSNPYLVKTAILAQEIAAYPSIKK